MIKTDQQKIEERYSQMATENDFKIDLNDSPIYFLSKEDSPFDLRVKYQRRKNNYFEVDVIAEFKNLEGLEELIELNQKSKLLLELNERLNQEGFPIDEVNNYDVVGFFELSYQVSAENESDVKEMNRFLNIVNNYLEERGK